MTDDRPHRQAEQRKRAEVLFQEAADLPTGERSAFLRTRCGSDDDLRLEVETLLEHEASAAPGFLAGTASGDAVLPTLHAGDFVGAYRIISAVGEGGFGTVYMAEQLEPIRRVVALKIVKLGMDTREVIARFETERQALAMMNHRNIAQVLDAGATDAGRPFFVMEFVKGVPVTEYCDTHRLDTDERLDLFLHVCDAVQHAHHKGVIHRDLKPSNVLVTVEDGDVVPKIIDFGMAKAVTQRIADGTLFTARGQLLGTPEYASPEQMEMSGLDVDARSDIYSLGVLLYEIVAGRTPFDRERLYGSGFDGMRRVVREEDPPRPSVRLDGLEAGDREQIAGRRRATASGLSRDLRGDLDWIVARAMEKDRTRRYSTASELAADIDRHRRQLPVLAGPPSVTYRARKFVRRHRAGVLAAATAVVALVAGTIGTATMAVVAHRQRGEATRAQGEAERARVGESMQRRAAEAAAAEARAINGFLERMLAAADPWSARATGGGHARDVRVVDVLDRMSDRIDTEFAEQALVEAEVRTLMARTYYNLGHLRKAEQHLARARSAWQGQRGDDHPETLRVTNDLGVLRTELGDFESARELLEAVLETRRQQHGPTDPRTVVSMKNLASMRRRQGRLDEARDLLERALAAQRDALGRNDPQALLTLNSLASVHMDGWRLGQAETLLQDGLETARVVLRPDHPGTLLLRRNLAGVLLARGRLEQAATQLDGLREVHERVLGEAHPDTVVCIGHLAVLARDRGRLEEADALLAEVLRRHVTHLGPRHPATAVAMQKLAGVRRRRGQLDDARQLLGDALVIQRDAWGDEHPDTLHTENGLGALLSQEGKHDEAERVLDRVLATRRRKLGDTNPATLASMSNLATVYRHLGRHDEAQQLAQAALEAAGQVLGADHPETLKCAFNLAVILDELGSNDQALPRFEQSLTGRRRVLPAAHPDIAETLVEYGECLVALDRHADAETALLEAHATLANARTMQSLAALYDAWGRPDDAATWRGRLQEASAEPGS